ncbi:MAG: glycosyltransferase family protein [Nibricoccus sp.]
MNIVAIIQARMGSSRLSGKTLADIAGQPLLGHVIDRAGASNRITKIVVATTTQPGDDLLVEYVEGKKAGLYRGSSDDVLDRYYQAAKLNKADVVVRLTADDPFIDVATVDLVIDKLLASDLEYVSNKVVPSYPEGLEVEAFLFVALEKAWREARLPSEREHVTPYIWKNPHVFRLAGLRYSRDLSSLRLTVDYEADLAFARAIYAQLYRGSPFGLEEVLLLIQRQPELLSINQNVQRYEGYYKSLQQDKEYENNGKRT